jgi:hypothetical protein
MGLIKYAVLPFVILFVVPASLSTILDLSRGLVCQQRCGFRVEKVRQKTRCRNDGRPVRPGPRRASDTSMNGT